MSGEGAAWPWQPHDFGSRMTYATIIRNNYLKEILGISNIERLNTTTQPQLILHYTFRDNLPPLQFIKKKIWPHILKQTPPFKMKKWNNLVETMNTWIQIVLNENFVAVLNTGFHLQRSAYKS